MKETLKLGCQAEKMTLTVFNWIGNSFKKLGHGPRSVVVTRWTGSNADTVLVGTQLNLCTCASDKGLVSDNAVTV